MSRLLFHRQEKNISRSGWISASATALLGLLVLASSLFAVVHHGTPTKLKSIAFAATNGTAYTLRFNVVGSTLSAKVWQAGTTEPTNWMLTLNDSSLTSGFCGLRTQLVSGATAQFTSFQATAQ